jgi:hypothetical protein
VGFLKTAGKLAFPSMQRRVRRMQAKGKVCSPHDTSSAAISAWAITPVRMVTMLPNIQISRLKLKQPSVTRGDFLVTNLVKRVLVFFQKRIGLYQSGHDTKKNRGKRH